MVKLNLIPSNKFIIQGAYKAALFIPFNSGLKFEDIQRIKQIVTWEQNINNLNDVILNGRSVIINKAYDNSGLQISGVGYLPINIGINNDSSLGYQGEIFQRPSNKNFLTKVTNSQNGGNVLGWTSPICKKINEITYYELINNYSNYKPAGTYDYKELSTKVKFTNLVSKIKLENLIVPKVEAYGFYLNNELKNSDGPFGFIINTAPSKKKERFAQEILNNKSNTMNLINGLSKMAKGLRELHDNGFFHLSPHASNFYLVNQKPYLMDWSTAEKISDNNELNIVYRAIDLTKLLNNFESIIKISGGNHYSLITGMSIILGSYVNEKMVNVVDIMNKAGRHKNIPKDFDITIQLLLDNDVESFNKKPKKILVKTANESINKFIKNNRIKITTPKRINKYERAKLKNKIKN
jgi:hypothetical protein